VNPTTLSQSIPVTMDTPVPELQDFEKIVHVYWPRIFRFVLASVRDEDAAETLTQDCFWRAYRSRMGFRGDSSVHTWLVHIAVNLVKDFSRNQRIQFWKRTVSSSVDASTISDCIASREMSAEAKAVLSEQVKAVWSATAVLSEKQRTVFLLRFVEEMDTAEISAATGISEGAVKVHLFRAVQSIRKRIRSLK
jgi:RNA polymerase sigma-70 factor (ECF subfamily)